MELELTRIFVKVVQLGSFSRAAEGLKVPVSTVSRGVTRLEVEVGTKLLHRTTRSLHLTPAGQAYFDASVAPLQALEDARNSLKGHQDELSGPVKITTVEDIGHLVVTPVIARLSRLHPGLRFEFIYTEKLVDLVKDGFDLAIRAGKMKPSGLKARRLGELRIIAVASPAYIARSARIRDPADLANHACIAFLREKAIFRSQALGQSRAVQLPAHPRAVGNHMQSNAVRLSASSRY